MRRFLSLFSIIMLLLPQGVVWSRPLVQEVDDPDVEAILEQMEPEERVGQLFLVTFYGTDVSPESDIATLITRYHVGGVVFLSENNNFTDETDLVLQVHQLTTDLQTLAAQRPQPPPGDTLGSTVGSGPYIPLFIGLEHEGSGGAHTHLLSGLTPLPSNMAIGATWDPAFSEATGAVVGEELAALGINLLLGPPVDVVEVPRPLTTGDFGTRVFGGEPYWVSQMAAAYVRGVHVGSNGHLAVVPRHFPGHGGADRYASVEVPTVRRSLDQLIQSDLKPFITVMSSTADPLDRADGVMTGHIRYQGFQGDNPRLATRPISLDSQNLQVLLELDAIAGWHDAGGLVISDALGLRGVRRFYDPQESSFPNRRIANEAFMAGNDLLYLGNFGSNPPVDQTAAVIDTIEYFVQVYDEDPSFQARVDDAVRRIIRKKLDLYGWFDLRAVLPPSGGLADLAQQSEVTLSVAQSALTLLSPGQPDLLVSPQAGEKILIFTDTRTVRQCESCEEQALVSIDALQSAILRAYGPQGSDLVGLADVSSFSFNRLVSYMEFGPPEAEPSEDGATPEPDPLAVALDSADWVVFAMLDVRSDVPSSDAVRRFLAGPPVSADTRIVVMALGAPYYLDSTEISKLTAYYALYGYTRPFIDTAARALFQQASLNGAPPVSVSGVDYDILKVTSPDPNQLIELSWSIERAGGEPEDEGGVEVGVETPTATATATPPAELYCIGDTLSLSTGVILDQNGHLVPDGTPVELVFNYVAQGLRDTLLVETGGGVASASLVLERPGELEISAVSGQASNSTTLRLPISEGCGVISRLTPTPIPTLTPTEPPATETTAEPPLPTPAPTPTPTKPPSPPKSVDFGDLFLALVGLSAIALSAFVVTVRRRDTNHSLLLVLPAVVFGLLGYNYYALVLPGAMAWRELFTNAWGAALATWVAALLGLGLMRLILYLWGRWLALR
jgi:beta-N-acetylhexosaminidase